MTGGDDGDEDEDENDQNKITIIKDSKPINDINIEPSAKEYNNIVKIINRYNDKYNKFNVISDIENIIFPPPKPKEDPAILEVKPGP